VVAEIVWMTGDQHNESPEELEQQFRDFNEWRGAAFNRNFETVKHLTTLSAGSVVLIGTFLQDIFPKTKGGELAVGLFTK
jgi:hypothetical protein